MYLIGSNATQALIPIPVNTATPESRSAGAHHARRVAALEHADYVLLVTEGWGLSRDDAPRYEEIIEKYGSLAGYPRHTDVLSLQLECREGVFGGEAPIKLKAPSKMRRTAGEPVFYQGDHASGRMAGILPPAGPPPTVH